MNRPDKCPKCHAAILHDGESAVYECVSTWVDGRINVRGTQCLERENARLRAAWSELRTFCQQGTLRSYSYGKVIAYMDTLLTQEPSDASVDHNYREGREGALSWNNRAMAMALKTICDLRRQLDARDAELAERTEQLQTIHAHVKEALELLGVDVSVDGYIPDSWTLREQCKMAKAEIERLRKRIDAKVSECRHLAYHWHSKWLNDFAAELEKDLAAVAPSAPAGRRGSSHDQTHRNPA